MGAWTLQATIEAAPFWLINIPILELLSCCPSSLQFHYATIHLGGALQEPLSHTTPDNTQLSLSKMAPSKQTHEAGLTLPGAGTKALQSICRAWGVGNAAHAIPDHLHPQNEHLANSWSPTFQTALKDIANITHRDELPDIQRLFQDTVDARRRKGKPSKVSYLNVADLKCVKHLYKHRRTIEREREERARAALEAEHAQRAQPQLDGEELKQDPEVKEEALDDLA
jgi:hypothetical protein